MQTGKNKELNTLLSFIRINGRRVVGALLTSGGPATIPRQISMLFIAGIICSVLVVPFHNNNGCILRTDCPLCKFAIDFSSCDKTDPETLVEPGFTIALFIPEVQSYIFGIYPASLTTRGPPTSLQSIRTK